MTIGSTYTASAKLIENLEVNLFNIGGNKMDFSAQLSLEQQFKLKVLQEQVQGLSKEQAQEYLLEMFRQMMVKDNLVKHLLKNA